MIVYLDASALVKLYVEEARARETREDVAQAELAATCQLTYVEVRAAIARKAREGGLPKGAQTSVPTALENDWKRYLVIEISHPLCHLAGSLLETHPLRAGDALHLAAALTTQKRTRRQVLFLCFDDRLRAAAGLEGLLVR